MNSINKYLSCFCVPGRDVHAKVRIPEPKAAHENVRSQPQNSQRKQNVNRSRQRLELQRNVRLGGSAKGAKVELIF